LRHQTLKAITNGDVDQLESCLRRGWDLNKPVDQNGKFSALSLACFLDNLEMVHLLDMYGADINQSVGE